MPDEIPNQAFTKRTRILKGWSDDAKYRVTTDDGRNLLLRVSAREKYDRKKRGIRSSQNDRIPGHSGTKTDRIWKMPRQLFGVHASQLD